MYRGSSDLSSVVRYFTLSFASFSASVKRKSAAFQARCAADRAAAATPSTSLDSLLLSCSVMELSMPMRLRQYSSSVSGPASSLSFTSFGAFWGSGACAFSDAVPPRADRPALAAVLPGDTDPGLFGGSSQPPPPKNASPPCVSESVASAVSIQRSRTSSRWCAIPGSSAASLNAAAPSSTRRAMCASGLASSAVAPSDVAASFRTAPNLRTFPRNSSDAAAPSAPLSLPQSRCALSAGWYRWLTIALSASSAEPLTTPNTTSAAGADTARAQTRTKYALAPVRPSEVLASVESVRTHGGDGGFGTSALPSSTSRSAGRAPPRGWYVKMSFLGPSASKKAETVGWKSRSCSIAATAVTSNAVASCGRARAAERGGTRGGGAWVSGGRRLRGRARKMWETTRKRGRGRAARARALRAPPAWAHRSNAPCPR